MTTDNGRGAQRAPGDYDGCWNPELMHRLVSALRPIVKTWHRSEVRGMRHVPEGGALLVSNHSGGLVSMDVVVLAIDFFDTFGYDRPLYHLVHDLLFRGPQAGLLTRSGLIRATRDNAENALRNGEAVLVFPGGDHDVYRPTMQSNAIDFKHRTGYVTTALRAKVPIVPIVSIGGHENQLYLSRGERLAEWLGLKRALRTGILPITFGVPFGLSVLLPINVPLPTKIVTEVLPPIDVVARFGADPDVDAVDKHIRSVMQTALDNLAAERRLPVLG